MGPSILLSAQVSGAWGDPRRRENPERRRRRGLAEKEPPLALAAPPTLFHRSALQRKGEDEEEEKKKGGGVGELDIKIDWGDGGRFLVSSAACFLKRQQQREKRSPSYDCRMLIAAAGVPRLLLEPEPDSEVVQLWTGRDI